MSRFTPTCEQCGHLHDDWCDAAVIDSTGGPLVCGCEAPCQACRGSGDLARWLGGDQDGMCTYCDGTGKAA